jgi:hypothetical protein
VRLTLESECRYAKYLYHQEKDITLLRKDQNLVLPRDLDYLQLPGLSTEVSGGGLLRIGASAGEGVRVWLVESVERVCERSPESEP